MPGQGTSSSNGFVIGPENSGCYYVDETNATVTSQPFSQTPGVYLVDSELHSRIISLRLPPSISVRNVARVLARTTVGLKQVQRFEFFPGLNALLTFETPERAKEHLFRRRRQAILQAIRPFATPAEQNELVALQMPKMANRLAYKPATYEFDPVFLSRTVLVHGFSGHHIMTWIEKGQPFVLRVGSIRRFGEDVRNVTLLLTTIKEGTATQLVNGGPRSFYYKKDHTTVSMTFSRPPDYGSAPPLDYGSVPAPGYGSVPQLDYGSVPAPDYGSAPPLDYGSVPAPGYGSAPPLDYGSAPSLGPGTSAQLPGVSHSQFSLPYAGGETIGTVAETVSCAEHFVPVKAEAYVEDLAEEGEISMAQSVPPFSAGDAWELDGDAGEPIDYGWSNLYQTASSSSRAPGSPDAALVDGPEISDHQSPLPGTTGPEISDRESRDALITHCAQDDPETSNCAHAQPQGPQEILNEKIDRLVDHVTRSGDGFVIGDQYIIDEQNHTLNDLLVTTLPARTCFSLDQLQRTHAIQQFNPQRCTVHQLALLLYRLGAGLIEQLQISDFFPSRIPTIQSLFVVFRPQANMARRNKLKLKLMQELKRLMDKTYYLNPLHIENYVASVQLATHLSQSELSRTVMVTGLPGHVRLDALVSHPFTARVKDLQRLDNDWKNITIVLTLGSRNDADTFLRQSEGMDFSVKNENYRLMFSPPTKSTLEQIEANRKDQSASSGREHVMSDPSVIGPQDHVTSPGQSLIGRPVEQSVVIGGHDHVTTNVTNDVAGRDQSTSSAGPNDLEMGISDPIEEWANQRNQLKRKTANTDEGPRQGRRRHAPNEYWAETSTTTIDKINDLVARVHDTENGFVIGDRYFIDQSDHTLTDESLYKLPLIGSLTDDVIDRTHVINQFNLKACKKTTIENLGMMFHKIAPGSIEQIQLSDFYPDICLFVVFRSRHARTTWEQQKLRDSLREELKKISKTNMYLKPFLSEHLVAFLRRKSSVPQELLDRTVLVDGLPGYRDTRAVKELYPFSLRDKTVPLYRLDRQDRQSIDWKTVTIALTLRSRGDAMELLDKSDGHLFTFKNINYRLTFTRPARGDTSEQLSYGVERRILTPSSHLDTSMDPGPSTTYVAPTHHGSYHSSHIPVHSATADTSVASTIADTSVDPGAGHGTAEHGSHHSSDYSAKRRMSSPTARADTSPSPGPSTFLTIPEQYDPTSGGYGDDDILRNYAGTAPGYDPLISGPDSVFSLPPGETQTRISTLPFVDPSQLGLKISRSRALVAWFLPPNLESDAVRNYFSNFGPISAMGQLNTGTSGLVTILVEFDHPKSLKSAVWQNQHLLDAVRVNCEELAKKLVIPTAYLPRGSGHHNPSGPGPSPSPGPGPVAQAHSVGSGLLPTTGYQRNVYDAPDPYYQPYASNPSGSEDFTCFQK